MRILAAILATSVIVVVTSTSFAEIYECEYEPNKAVSYSYGDSVRAKFIVVDFPDPNACTNVTVTDTVHQKIVDTMIWWLKSHSQRKLEFTHDSGLLLKYGEDFRDGTADPWVADLISQGYQDESELTQEEIEFYHCRWDSTQECQEFVAHIEDWWTGGINISSLYAEILYKIYADYEPQSTSSWPFGYYDGSPD